MRRYLRTASNNGPIVLGGVRDGHRESGTINLDRDWVGFIPGGEVLHKRNRSRDCDGMFCLSDYP